MPVSDPTVAGTVLLVLKVSIGADLTSRYSELVEAIIGLMWYLHPTGIGAREGKA